MSILHLWNWFIFLSSTFLHSISSWKKRKKCVTNFHSVLQHSHSLLRVFSITQDINQLIITRWRGPPTIPCSFSSQNESDTIILHVYSQLYVMCISVSQTSYIGKPLLLLSVAWWSLPQHLGMGKSLLSLIFGRSSDPTEPRIKKEQELAVGIFRRKLLPTSSHYIFLIIIFLLIFPLFKDLINIFSKFYNWLWLSWR